MGEGREAANGSGGSNWSPGLALKPPSLGPQDAFACGLGSYGDPAWTAGVVDGVAGSDAATVEVETPAGIESAPLTSPVGAWVVAFDGHLGAIVRVRDADGIVLCENRVEPL